MKAEEELKLLKEFFTWDVEWLLEMKEKNQKINNSTCYLRERWMGDTLISISIMKKDANKLSTEDLQEMI